jgi:hypothetical protein
MCQWPGNAVERCATSGSPSRTSFSVTVSNVLFTLMLSFVLLFRMTSQSMSTATSSRPWPTVWLTSAHAGDRILILNILRGLNQRVCSIIRRYSSFLNLLKVWDDLEEIHMDGTGPPAAPTTLYTNVASPAAKASSFTPSRRPNGKNGSIGGNRTKYNNKYHNDGNGGGHNGKNNTDGGGRGGSSGQTTAPSGFAGRTNAP